MAGENNNNLQKFVNSGVYKFPNSNAVFIDPVRILNRNYSKFRVSASSYYPRFFNPKPSIENHEELEQQEIGVIVNSKKRRKNQNKSIQKKKQCYDLNEKELLADQRHKEIRPLLVKAHEDLLRAKELLDMMCELNCNPEGWEPCVDLISSEVKEASFFELGKVWQAPFYDITVGVDEAKKQRDEIGGSPNQHDDQRLVSVFNNYVCNEAKDDVVAEFLTSKYLLPKESCFYMSDLGRIQDLVPAVADCGYNFIVIDPPWENRSAYQKSAYPTLPNRYFLSIPIRQLTHTGGALVALWVTNREKLRTFVEHELFPAWGVRYAATLYWLKVKADGSLICDLDLFHHRPYECLLLGYSGEVGTAPDLLPTKKLLRDDKVMITVPGDYSRKPPVGDLLEDYVPGPSPPRCIELFAREMMAGWISWGNEPLHFQDLRYFCEENRQCQN